jgi:hypothetical protein
LLIILLFLGASGWVAKHFLFSDNGPVSKPIDDISSRSSSSSFRRVRTLATTNPTPVTIDLLKGLDLSTAVVQGHWVLKDGAVVSDTGAATRFDFRYRPPGEYDLRVEFSRLSGSDGIDTILCANGRQFLWTMGGWHNTISGFAEVFGKAADANPTTVRASLKNGQRYSCVLKVRNDGVQAFLDDVLVRSWTTDFDDLAMSSRRVHRPDTLGISSWESSYAIYSAQVTEISGFGRRVSPTDPLDAEAIAIWAYTVADRSPVEHKMYSNGHMKTPNGEELWFLRGNQILFRWGEWLDAGTLAPDRKSFDGTNQSGEKIHGDLVWGGL